MEKDYFSRYEEIILVRDEVRKAEEQAQVAYIREFGDLMVENCRIRMEFLRKQRTISYFQQMAHFGKQPNDEQTEFIIGKQMEEKEQELEEVIRENQAIKALVPPSEEEAAAIRALYREIALMIHPDLHEALEEDKDCLALWEKVKDAYVHDRKEDLVALREEAARFLEEKQPPAQNREIPPQGLAMRIRQISEEIRQIKEADPYAFYELLGDPDAVAAQKQALQEEADRYRRYTQKLEDEIDNFDIRR